MEEEWPTIKTHWNRTAFKATLLTGNHWGIAVFLLVAVFVGAETLHEAQVALSQELAKWSKDNNIPNYWSKLIPVHDECNAARADRFSWQEKLKTNPNVW